MHLNLKCLSKDKRFQVALSSKIPVWPSCMPYRHVKNLSIAAGLNSKSKHVKIGCISLENNEIKKSDYFSKEYHSHRSDAFQSGYCNLQ